MCFSSPSSPQMPAAPAPMPTTSAPEVLAAQDAERKRRAKAGGYASTLLAPTTSNGAPLGAPKTLLGG